MRIHEEYFVITIVLSSLQMICDNGRNCSIHYMDQAVCKVYNHTCFPCEWEKCTFELHYNTMCELAACGPIPSPSPSPSGGKGWFAIALASGVVVLLVAVMVICLRRFCRRAEEHESDEEEGQQQQQQQPQLEQQQQQVV